MDVNAEHEENGILKEDKKSRAEIIKSNTDATLEESTKLVPDENEIPKTGGFVKPNEHKPWHEKYTRAFSILIPWNRTSKDGNESPLEKSGCFSYFTVGWITQIMVKAFRSGLGYSDLFRLPTLDQSKESAARLQRLWEEEQENANKMNRQPSFAKACAKFCQTRVIISSIFFSCCVVLQFLSPSLVLKMILDYVGDPSRDDSEGWWLLALLASMLLLRLAFFTLNFNVGLQTAIRLGGATQYLGFSKLLRLSNINEQSLGQMVTFCTGDQERISETVVIIVLLFGTPIMFTLSTMYSWLLVGPMALLGLLIVLLLYPIMGGVATLTAHFRRKVLVHTEKRVSLMNEVINSIRLIKMYAWEDSFNEKIQNIRLDEMRALQKTAFLQSISFSITPCITVVAAVVTIIALTNTEFVLTGPVAFTLFSIFTALQFTVATLPIGLRSMAESKVCFERMKKFLVLPEYQPPSRNKNDQTDTEGNGNVALLLEQYNGARDIVKEPKKDKKDQKNNSESNNKETKKEEQEEEEGNDLIKNNQETTVQVLFDVDLKVEKGQLIGVAGAVGSGKSSLIASIMNELRHLSGQMCVNGRLALVPQQAWIYSGTVRENILFGSKYNKDIFDEVVESAALKPDLEQWPNGDLTEVGERGLSLSGGQKQRISLARALYAVLIDQKTEKAEFVVLLDDPLSAVDPSVAKHIYENSIAKILKNQTVLLVTHGLQFLEKCDKIAFMKNGTVTEFGTYQELMADGKGLLNMSSYDQSQKEEIANFNEASNENSVTRQRLISVTSLGKQQNVAGKENEALEEKEEEDQMNAGWSVLLKYFEACGGYLVMFTIFFVVFLFALVRIFTSVWLKIWLDDGDGRKNERTFNATTFENDTIILTDEEIRGNIADNPQLEKFQLVHGMSLIVLVVIGLVKGFSMALALLKGSSKLHGQMLQRVMRCPMSFFDTTPAGKIINRFSKDMDELDVRMPYYTEFVVQALFLCLSQIFVVCLVYPMFIFIAFGIVGLFIFFDVYMNRGVLEARKLENKSKSPVLTDITSIMPGISVIRGFERQSVFQDKFSVDLNRNLAAQMLFRYSNRWYGFRMDLLGTLTILCTAGVCIFSRGSVTPAEAGLALANVFQVATFIPYVMRMKADFRARFNSVERISEYAYDLDQEASAQTDEKKIKLPPGWPSKGQVELKELSYRYRPSTPLVLNNISVKIEAGSKVGVVGRTGAGKTSLFSAILRLAEIEAGEVLVDEVDVSQIGLGDLRSAIAVIPQDPVLFQGTIRYNLDPFNQYDDEAIWSAIEKSHLKDKISENGAGLNMIVANDGDNLSVGEKQLLCLGRALLRKNKILLLDEATASVDVETDYKIQATIKEAFFECTVVTIAHRIHTVMNYDKIIVMKSGEVIEHGTPEDLLKMSDGTFKSLLKSAQMESS